MKAYKIKIVLINFVYLIIAFLTLSSCENDEDNTINKKNDNSDLIVLFQYEYMNWAWGYSHSGWFIDNHGNVKGYNLPDHWKWTDSLGYITYDSLIYNYNQSDTLYCQIDTTTLYEKSQLIDETINGNLSDLNCHGADIGGMALYCYSWDRIKYKYKRQLLAETGDCEQINTTPEAIQLTDYLIQVGKLNAQCFWFSCLKE